MFKTTVLILLTVLTQVFAQTSINTLQSTDEAVQEALQYYNRKNYEQAKAMLEKIIDQDKNNAEAHLSLAYTLFQLKSLKAAVETCERAVELDENNAEYHYNLARLYGESTADAGILRLPSLGRKIRKEAEKALDLDPDHLGARILLGTFYLQAPGMFGGSNKKAIEHATIASRHDEWQGRLLLIRIYNKMEEYDKAENECRLLENVSNNNMELQLVMFNEYGFLLVKKNRIDEAIEKYQKLVTIAPDRSWTHNVLGNAYLLNGNYSTALNKFKEALSINPESEYAKEKIEEIYKKHQNSSGSQFSGSETQEIKISSDDVMLYVRIAGDPEAENVLITLHGGPGNSSDYMVGMEKLQSDDLTVVTYDQRGSGHSTESSNGYGLNEHIQDLEAIRMVLNKEKIHVMGHSWGGVLALRYASRYPERVRSMILMGSGPPSFKSSRPGQAHLGQRIMQLQRDGMVPSEFTGSDKELIQSILPAYFSDPKYEIPEELENMSFDRAISNQTLSEVGEWDFTEDVGKLDHDILFLWGEDDPFGLPMARETVNTLSSAEVHFVTLKGCGHYWYESEEEFLSEVRRFLGLSDF